MQLAIYSSRTGFLTHEYRVHRSKMTEPRAWNARQQCNRRDKSFRSSSVASLQATRARACADFSVRIGSRCDVLAARRGSPFTAPSRPARTLPESSDPCSDCSETFVSCWKLDFRRSLDPWIDPHFQMSPPGIGGSGNLDLLMLARTSARLCQCSFL